VEPRECNSLCVGDATEICGGTRAISLYSNTGSITGIADVAGWTYVSCYIDAATRTLGGPTFTAADMTPARCGAFCSAGGWRFFGVENGNECWCGNTGPGPDKVADATSCNAHCAGDQTVLCGGGWRLNVYGRTGAIPPIQTVEGWTYANCYTDDWVRTLPTQNPTNTQLTPSVCADLCSGRQYFGVEAGNECWCGDSVDASKIAADPTTCNTPCTGQPNLVCGGGWRLTVYHKNPPITEIVPGWRNMSCFIDSSTRTLNGVAFQTTPQMTAGRCAQLCCGWKYFGVQYGAECFCGNNVNPALAAPTHVVIVAGADRAAVLSRGGWRLSVYEDLPGDAPGCASSCNVTRSCDQDNCQGSFDMATGIATCKGAFAGCTCEPTGQTCGAPQSCDLNQCAGTFDAGGLRATCKGFFKGCECRPTTNTCGAVQSCDANNCQGTFDLSDGKAYCSNFHRGCECQSTRTTCGNPLSCDMNNCAGTYSLTDGKAYCSNFFRGCECLGTPNTCGTPQSCDGNNCQGVFSMQDGKAYCSNFFRGCECRATGGTCGSPQSCDMNNCYGAFDMGNGLAYCQGWFAGCQCSATEMTCGPPQSCDMNDCAGTFDLGSGVAFCRNHFAGCRCAATANTCGAWQSCDMNGCAGAYDANGEARCRGKFAGCRCNPTGNTCGEQQSCDLNGCNGGWDSEGVARCRSNFAGCLCRPTTNTCGTPQACSLNGCNGRADGAGQGWCQDRFAGCRCNAGTATPGYCGVLTSCSFSGCQGIDVGEQFGRCQAASHRGCTCILPPKPPTPPTTNPPRDCVADCLQIVSQLNRLPEWACTNDGDFWWGPPGGGPYGTANNEAVEWWCHFRRQVGPQIRVS
jgi:hypothetical protein